MNIPANLTIIRAGLLMDGGSIQLNAMDSHNKSYEIRFSQAFNDPYRNHLYVNNKPIVHGSSDEINSIQALRQADIQADTKYSSATTIANLRDQLIELLTNAE